MNTIQPIHTDGRNRRGDTPDFGELLVQSIGIIAGAALVALLRIIAG